MSEERGRISDVLGPAFPEAEVVPLDEVLGEELLFKGYAHRKGVFGIFAVILAEHDGVEVCFITGSGVVLDQLEQIKEALPLWGKIVKQKNYYTLQ